MCLLDYDYGTALGSNRGHPSSESAIDSAFVRGNCPMNSLGLRTESMLDSLELFARFADPAARSATRDPWWERTSPLLGRHTGDEEEEEVADDELEDDDDLEDDDFDDDEDDEAFDDEDFDDEDEDDIDEELDDEIEDIDVDEDEDDEFDDDEDLGGLDEDEDEDAEVP
jgi:hypothetical protein